MKDISRRFKLGADLKPKLNQTLDSSWVKDVSFYMLYLKCRLSAMEMKI